MVERVDIKQLYRNTDAFSDQTVVVKGWIRTLRNSKTIAFIEINDGTFFRNLQIVVESSLQNFEEISKLPIATAIEAKGKLVKTQGAKQAFEILAEDIRVLAGSVSDFPLQKKRHTPEFLRSIAHLRPRANLFQAAFRVRSVTAYAIHKFFQERGYLYVHTPIITASDAEGAGEMFRVTTLDMQSVPFKEDGSVDFEKDFFKKDTNLTVSGQLEAEAFALAFQKVYTFGPTFRSEHSNTVRHAAEFWMVEPEVAFADLEINMNLAEDMIKYIIGYVLKELPEEMSFFNQFVDKGLLERLTLVKDSDFIRISYTEAIDILKNAKKEFNYPVEWGLDLQTEHERYLTEEHFEKPVFVTDYPKQIKSFYMRVNEDQKTVAAMDLLVPGIGEIIGGSQREERIELLEQRMQELEMEEEAYWWYLELRKYGGVQHAGYGLGFERMIMYLTGIVNIRDVIPFPRTVGSAEF